MKNNKLAKIIILFLSIMFVFTIVSRVRDTIKTPKVKVTVPSAQIITYELEKRLVAEGSEEGYLVVRTELTDEEAGYIDSSAEVQIESAPKNVYIEDAVLAVNENVETGRRELVITFKDNALKTGDAVTAKARYSSPPYSCCVPVSALHQSSDNRNFVYVTEEQDVILGERIIAKMIEVEVEEQDLRYAALKSNSLSNENQIIYETNKEFERNERIRVIKEN